MWRYEVYADTGSNYRWRLKSSNGRKVAASGESFASASNAQRAATNFKQHARSWGYEIYADRSGNYRWRANSNNGQTVATSGEAFDSRHNAERSVENVRQNAGSAAGP